MENVSFEVLLQPIVDKEKKVKYQHLKVIKKKGDTQEELIKGKLLHFMDNQFSILKGFLEENQRFLVDLPLDFLLSKSLIEPLDLKKLNFLATDPVSKFTKKHVFQLKELAKRYNEKGLELSISASTFEKFKIQLAPIKFTFFYCSLNDKPYKPACFHGVDSEQIFEQVKEKGELFCGKLFGDFQKITEITALSYLKTTIVRALEMLEEEEVKIKDLELLIKTDPQLSLSIVKYANSPLIAPLKPIKDLRHAIVYLGLDKLQQFLITLKMSQQASIDAEFQKLALTISAYGFLMEQKARRIRKYVQCHPFLLGLILGAQKVLKQPLNQIIAMLEPPQPCQDALNHKKINEIFNEIKPSDIFRVLTELKKLLGSSVGV